jgi:hypothetical protein
MSLNCLKDRKLDQNKKKQTPTKIWTKISETKISQTLLEEMEKLIKYLKEIGFFDKKNKIK